MRLRTASCVALRGLTHFVPVLFVAAPLAGQTPTSRTTVLAAITTHGDGIYDVTAAHGGRNFYYKFADSIFLYDVASRRATPITTGRTWRMIVSPRGDLLAFSRSEAASADEYIWTLPLDPRTGLPSGPARRASLRTGDYPTFSPDGRSIAFVSDTSILVMPSSGGAERLVHTVGGGPVNLRWSPDGQWLYYRRDTDDDAMFERVSVQGGRPRRIADSLAASLPSVSPAGPLVGFSTNLRPLAIEIIDTAGRHLGDLPGFSEDRRWLSASQMLQWTTIQQNSLNSISLVDRITRRLLPASANIEDVAWSPDGKQFAAISVVNDSARVLIVDSNGTIRRTVRLPGHYPNGETTWSPSDLSWSPGELSWSPDGSRLVVAVNYPMRLLTIVAATGSMVQLRTTGLVDRPHWMADSRHILYVSGTTKAEGGSRAIRKVSIDGKDELVRQVGTGIDNRGGVVDDWALYGDEWNVRFASDTTIVREYGDTVDVLSLTTGQSARVLTAHSGPPSASARGDLLVIRPLDGADSARFEIFSPAGQRLATVRIPGLRHGPYVLRRVLVSPDSKEVIFSSGIASRQYRPCCQISRARIDGSPMQSIVVLEGQNNNHAPFMALSPDGKTLLYTSGGPYLTRFYVTDVSDLLARASNR